jgi:hypothetical protein
MMCDINKNYGFSPNTDNFESNTGVHFDGVKKNDRIEVTLQDPRSEDNAIFGTAPYGQSSRMHVGLMKQDGQTFDLPLIMI